MNVAAKSLQLELWALQEDPLRQDNGQNWYLSDHNKVCILDARKWRTQILAALRCYQSQLQVFDTDTVLHVGGQIQRLLDREVLQQII